MTCKDHVLLAATLRSLHDNLTTRHDYDVVITRVTNALSEAYPNFDRTRFMEVCYS